MYYLYQYSNTYIATIYRCDTSKSTFMHICRIHVAILRGRGKSKYRL